MAVVVGCMVQWLCCIVGLNFQPLFEVLLLPVSCSLCLNAFSLPSSVKKVEADACRMFERKLAQQVFQAGVARLLMLLLEWKAASAAAVAAVD